MTKLYRMKEFSKLTSVTKRALQYYDDINLLTPSSKTESGHRLYSEADILKLQQITTLKYLGFTLEQIKNLVIYQDMGLEQSLIMQCEMLSTQASQIQQSIKLAQHALTMLQQEGNVDWNDISTMIGVLNMKETNVDSWFKKFFTTQQEYNQFNSQFTPSEWKDYSDRWDQMFKEGTKLLNTDPAANASQNFVKRWLALVEVAYSNYPEIRKKTWEAFKTNEGAIQNLPYFNKELIEFIEKAAEVYRKNSSN